MKQTLWCCVGYNFKNPYYGWQSLHYTRTGCIKKHIAGGNWTWVKWKRKGWKCIKVEVIVKPINEVK